MLVLAISPDFESYSTLIAGTTDGVYRSTDGGDSWKAANKGLTGALLLSLSISPTYAEDSTMFAGLVKSRVARSFAGGEFTTPTGGLFRSINGGDSWQSVEGLVDVSVLSITPSHDVCRDP